MGDVYEEIGPHDSDYARLSKQAVTMDELERRQAGWAAGDEALRQEFLEFARLVEDRSWPDRDRPDDPWPGQAPGQASGPDTE